MIAEQYGIAAGAGPYRLYIGPGMQNVLEILFFLGNRL